MAGPSSFLHPGTGQQCSGTLLMRTTRLPRAAAAFRPARYPARRPQAQVAVTAVADSKQQQQASQEPLMVRAARGEDVERAPCWMMRQAGRYQKSYRELAKRHPSFRERSETTDLIVEISMQPWNSFRPDGVILFSDILTPLPAMGIAFDIDDNKGPIIDQPIKSMAQVNAMHDLDLDKLQFVGRSLQQLRQEVNNQAAIIGFVGSPWTLATYLIEGGSTSLYKNIKALCYSNPQLLDALLSMLTKQTATYIKYQIDSGAQTVQIFDSWGGQLPPREWDRWSGPYLKRIVEDVRATHPHVPLTLYANGSGGLLERLKSTGVDVVGVDWTVDMADARRRLGNDVALQGNVDPTILFASHDAITEVVKDCVRKAGGKRHILNLGHGVLVGTPEENVAHMFALSKTLKYADLMKA